MPRVAIKKRDYMIRDLTGWIIGKMHEKGMSQEELAAELGIGQAALSSRLNPKRYKSGKTKDPFSYGDLLTLFKLFEVPDEEKQRLISL